MEKWRQRRWLSRQMGYCKGLCRASTSREQPLHTASQDPRLQFYSHMGLSLIKNMKDMETSSPLEPLVGLKSGQIDRSLEQLINTLHRLMKYGSERHKCILCHKTFGYFYGTNENGDKERQKSTGVCIVYIHTNMYIHVYMYHACTLA